MNAIFDNDFTKELVKLRKKIVKTKIVMVISAHWLTKGTYVLCDERPKMIYEMYGIQEESYWKMQVRSCNLGYTKK